MPEIRILHCDPKHTIVLYESSLARVRLTTNTLKRAFNQGEIKIVNPERLHGLSQ